jgi:deoxyribodipyrimidine photolyase-related protein
MNTTIWILGDQLLEDHPAVKFITNAQEATNFVILIIESQARLQSLPYHRKKLILLLSAMRHYAGKLQRQGYPVDYRRAPDMLSAIKAHLQQYRTKRLVTMQASTQRGWNFQERLANQLPASVEILPNSQFLVGLYDPFPENNPGRRHTQENFYRAMRRHFNLLMEINGEPLGGKWNFDSENRRRLPSGIQPPPAIVFEPDQITREVIHQVNNYPNLNGTDEGFDMAVTHEDANRAMEDFIANRLVNYGAYQDAMNSSQDLLFHSMLSPYLNLGLLEPLNVAHRVEQAYQNGWAPINSTEGFIRQIIGWREYIYWQYWRQGPTLNSINHWEHSSPLPGFFWDGDTEMNCLRTVIQRVIRLGYAHHIERLMILCNFCLLSGIEPKAVNDWFLALFVDAHEWVMIPNVLGMGLYADGGRIATKPYIASANYINKMSDYCTGCKYHHNERTGASACPFNYLYWNFLIQHEERLRANPRMSTSLLGLRRFSSLEVSVIQEKAREFLQSL